MKRAANTNTLSLPDSIQMMLDPADEMQSLISELNKKLNHCGQSCEHFMSYIHMNHGQTAQMLSELWDRIDTDIEHRYLTNSISKSELINWHHDLKAYRALMLSLLNEYEAEHKKESRQRKLMGEAA